MSLVFTYLMWPVWSYFSQLSLDPGESSQWNQCHTNLEFSFPNFRLVEAAAVVVSGWQRDAGVADPVGPSKAVLPPDNY